MATPHSARRSPSFSIAVVAALAVGLAGACTSSRAPRTVAEPEPTGSPAAVPSHTAAASVAIDCGSASQPAPNPIAVSTTIPVDASFPGGSTSTIAGLQCDFDVFSWNSFIAVNHAPDGRFGGDDGDNPTTWESWPESSNIFLPGGAEPLEWKAGEPPPAGPIPEVCRGQAGGGALPVFRQLGKTPDVLEATDQPFLSGPLIDTHGWYSRFIITVNQEMYAYIRDHALYGRSGQKTFADGGNTVAFPCGCAGAPCAPGGQQGAIMVKAAWKVIDVAHGDDPSRFHTTDALVLTPAREGVPATCERRTMGLVGLHIGHKTQGSPQWLWSTFEQVDNVPTQGAAASAQRYNYFLPGCEGCNAVNVPPPQPWQPHDEPIADDARKSQIERAIPITVFNETMNAQVQEELLAGTVWRYYQLVSTQWPTHASDDSTTSPAAANGWCAGLNVTDNTGAPAPQFLANTTLETYIQGTVPLASSSCINCHLNATMAEGVRNFSDFTYLLERAQ